MFGVVGVDLFIFATVQLLSNVANLFSKHHFVKRPNEKSCRKNKKLRLYRTTNNIKCFVCFCTVQEFSMKHCHSCHASNKLEVRQMVLVAEPRVRVDLKSVIVTAKINIGIDKIARLLVTSRNIHSIQRNRFECFTASRSSFVQGHGHCAALTIRV